ncbi:MAG TPA: hypothetical protein PLV92_24450, partial [Pirellulaceae bacterium]|nr:hypothetical protein [Pirellulaceae bacterium]
MTENQTGELAGGAKNEKTEIRARRDWGVTWPGRLAPAKQKRERPVEMTPVPNGTAVPFGHVPRSSDRRV